MTPPPPIGRNGPNAPTDTESGYESMGSTPWSSTSTTKAGSGNAGSDSPESAAAPIAGPTDGSGRVGGPDATTSSLPSLAPVGAPPASAPGQSALGQAGAGTRTPPPAAATTRRAAGSRARGPRRARLQLRHIDPWTVLKFSCVLSIALFFVWLIVIGVLYGVLDGAGVIGKINDAVTTINGGNAKPPVTAGIVFGGAAIIGVVNIVLFIALSTIGSVIYNLCADLVGGIEVTLSER